MTTSVTDRLPSSALHSTGRMDHDITESQAAWGSMPARTILRLSCMRQNAASTSGGCSASQSQLSSGKSAVRCS